MDRLQLGFRFTIARAKLVSAQGRDEPIGLEDGFGFEHEIDGAGQFNGQDRVGLEFVAAHARFKPLCQWAHHAIAFGHHCRFAKGPTEIGVAEFGPAEAFDFAGAGDGAFDQAAIGEEIFDGGEAGDVADLVEEGQAEELADARCGLEKGEIAAGGFLGEFEELFFERGQLGVVMADEGQVVFEGELAHGVIFLGEELFGPVLASFRALAEDWPVVRQLMRLDAGQQFGAVPDVEEALAQERAQGPFLGGINVAWRNEVGAEQVGDFFRVNAVIFVFAAVDGLEVEGVGQDEVEARSLAGIGEPIPAEHAFGADGQVVLIRGDELEEVVEIVVADVGVDELFAVAVHDADVHLAGMEVNSAVELGGGRVILHSDHSLWGRETPVNAFGHAGRCV